MKKSLFLIINYLCLIILFIPNNLNAQTFTTGHAVAISTDSEEILPGSIIINKDSLFSISQSAYDMYLFGVTSENPSTYIDDGTAENKQFVVTHGETYIRANTSNGMIREGDFLTSSSTAGVAQKALQTGQIIGTALEPLNEGEGLVLAFIEVRTQYIETSTSDNLLQNIRKAINTPFISPLVSLRYLLAALLIIISLFLGFFNFRRISGSSIEALGRNPLAQKTIRATVLLNFFITGTIMITGIVLAIAILIL